MHTADGIHWDPNHAWAMVERRDPPKRPACERTGDWGEIYDLYDDETAREQASRCILCPRPSCVDACPLHNRIPEWLSLTAEGRFLEAAELSRTTSNMPEICSRVCPQERLCEGSCILNGKTDPVAIGAVERFIQERAFQAGEVTAQHPPPNGRRAAVVGSGPAGLACADQLASWGYAVVVYELQSLPGGLLMNGIPSFKLEKPLVDRRVDVLRARGVLFRTGVALGRDVSLRQLLTGYDVVFLGVGAQKPKALGVPGEHLPGVWQALSLLIRHPLEPGGGEIPAEAVAGRRVVVLGGGDTAMDCLRTALRCGAAEAVCIYRRDLENMPGSRKEYINAIEEGAEFSFLTNPLSIEAGPDGSVCGVRCVKMRLGEPDAGGRRKPEPVPGSETFVPADLVIGAYGYDPVPFPANSDLSVLQVNEWGGLVIDADGMTSVPGVFTGGDASRGPALVVHAVRDGRRAAEAMDRYVRRKSVKVEKAESLKV